MAELLVVCALLVFKVIAELVWTRSIEALMRKVTSRQDQDPW
jgi:hypothetical protein